jgi:hypothetical protein
MIAIMIIRQFLLWEKEINLIMGIQMYMVMNQIKDKEFEKYRCMIREKEMNELISKLLELT